MKSYMENEKKIEIKDYTIKRLVKYIKENGLRQDFIANKLGCTGVQISLWTHGVIPRKNWKRSINTFLDSVNAK